MQKTYDTYFAVGVLLALGLAAVAGVSLFHFVIGSEYLVFVPLAIIAVFSPLSLLFRASNKGWVLRLPGRVSPEAFQFISAVCLLLAVAAFAYGFFAWPYAPLRQIGDTYLDKLGHALTRRDYDSFRRWETIYLSLWSVVAIAGLLSLPFLSVKERRYRFGASL